jgi:hypothetical protein
MDARDTYNWGEIECKLPLQRHGEQGSKEQTGNIAWAVRQSGVGVVGRARRLIVVRGKLARQILGSSPSLDLVIQSLLDAC